MGMVMQACCNEAESKNKEQTRMRAVHPHHHHNHDQKAHHKEKVNPSTEPTSEVEKVEEHSSDSDERLKRQTGIQRLEEMYPAQVDAHKITWKSFKITHELGHGGFGFVFLGTLKQQADSSVPSQFAIKCIRKDRIKGGCLLKCIQLQRKILHDAHCNFITKLYYAFRDEHYLYLALDYAEGGDTFTFISHRNDRFEAFKKLGEQGVRFVLGCAILGLQYLHKHTIMYRDLKPQNLLVYSDGYVKLTDFGLAKLVKEGQYAHGQKGSPLYFAPQVADGRKSYSEEIDFWTLGVYAYEISNYHPPFSVDQIENPGLFRAIAKRAESYRVWKNPYISPQLKDFIDRLLRYEPSERMGYNSWAQVKNHNFFTSVNFDWDALKHKKMESPLKALIDEYPISRKPYDPSTSRFTKQRTGKVRLEIKWTLGPDAEVADQIGSNSLNFSRMTQAQNQ